MPFRPLYGHDLLRRRLSDAVRSGTLPQSMLFHGAQGVGKQRLALWLGQLLVCDRSPAPCDSCRHCKLVLNGQHPDVTWVFPRPRLKDADASPDAIRNDLSAGTTERLKLDALYAAPSGSEGIHVATMRMVVRQSALKPALAARKVIVIGDADRMVSQEGTEHAANAFLKLLEEPPPNTTIVLTSSQPGALLPTVRSRVIAIRVPNVAAAAAAAWLADEGVAKVLAAANVPEDHKTRLAQLGGSPGLLFSADKERSLTKDAEEAIQIAESGDRGAIAQFALERGSAGARGAYSDMLDAMVEILRDLARLAVNDGHVTRAKGAARAIERVEDAKAMAYGNVNPQLITAALLRDISRLLRGSSQ